MFFTTARLTVRPAQEEDVGWMPACRHAPSLQQRERFDDRFPPSVVLDPSGEEIGVVFIWPQQARHWRLEFALLESATGQGYAREMIRAWGHRFQQSCPGEALLAQVESGDDAAEAVLRFAGFEPQAAGVYRLPEAYQ
ncbi:GNAT family N-acetyltransferase [Marinobacter hydrocarbonoclasticus]|nr:GNAT family N-acetyltransferase [Marinobacter nauticus]